MKPTYEQLEADLAEANEKIVELTELLQLALEEIADLKEKLKLNSKNSSKPPSSDQKPNTVNKDRKKRKSRQGFAREAYPPERIDENIDCIFENCPHCGSHSIENIGTPEVLQQAELPNVRAIITQYLLYKYRCHGCGKRSIANLPSGVPDSSFGPHLMGLFATLTGVLHLAKREAIQLIKDLYDIDIGLGSATNIEERVSKALDPIYRRKGLKGVRSNISQNSQSYH
jgi:transposase